MKHFAYAILVLAWMSISPGASSQGIEELPTYIDNDLRLNEGIYKVQPNTIVTNNATLEIGSNCLLLFNPDAQISVRGGLEIRGDARNFAQFKSMNANRPGKGFLIEGADDRRIIVDYGRFTDLELPIKFQRNWIRSSVVVSNSIFKDLISKKVIIEFQDVDNVLTKEQIRVSIHSNTFSNNSAGILIANIASQNIRYELTNNVISRNQFIGRDLNGIFTTPLFINYKSGYYGTKPLISNNSISYNFGSQLLPDTVEFFPVFVTTIGSGDIVNLNNNYFGFQGKESFDEVISQISSTTQAPFIEIDQTLDKPDAQLNGHIYKIGINGNRIDHPFYNIQINKDIETIDLVSNRQIFAGKKLRIQYAYLWDDTIRFNNFRHKLIQDNNRHRTIIEVRDRVFKDFEHGFIIIDGLVDANGFDVPSVQIGLKDFISTYREFIMLYPDWRNIPRSEDPVIIVSDPPGMDADSTQKDRVTEEEADDVIFDNEIGNDSLLIVKKEKYWDAGVLLGSTIYFGDLAFTGIQLYIPNARPNLGLRLGYHVSKRFRVEFAQNNMIISGDDRRSTVVGKNRGTNYDRGLSFRTTIIDFAFKTEYQFWEFKTMKSLVPSVFSGASVFYFKPMGQVGGQYYDLRSIGTEGQTLDGSEYAYEKWGYGIPFGFKLSKHVNANTIIALSYVYNKIFTDYLDDVSAGYYPEQEALKAANPDLEDISVRLSNPNNLTGQRSTSANYDGYAYWGIQILKKF